MKKTFVVTDDTLKDIKECTSYSEATQFIASAAPGTYYIMEKFEVSEPEFKPE